MDAFIDRAMPSCNLGVRYCVRNYKMERAELYTNSLTCGSNFAIKINKQWM